MGKRIVVEVMSMEKLEVPIRYQGEDLVKLENLPTLVDIANFILTRGKERLPYLKREVIRLCSG